MATRVRLFQGDRWQDAEMAGDVTVDVVPAIGHHLALAGDDRWRVGKVVDIAHRIVDADEAADIALLVSRLIEGGSLDEPLPLAALDGEVGAMSPAPAPAPPPAPSRGPWG
ncbi:hypothetical protein GGQ80_002899 [Sphingomonas jinjuensis]|uniref:Uncharacterized protein n=1 Tax=Sphingomonas jinjuensis TaxID=535907 RepID=A0A840FE81_9SPHN|nr:hypothetical protein [Sphingomonas jinjuensis]MBB4154982.1 hypothetical protein [Sphingomonas jinjuensis]